MNKLTCCDIHGNNCLQGRACPLRATRMKQCYSQRKELRHYVRQQEVVIDLDAIESRIASLRAFIARHAEQAIHGFVCGAGLSVGVLVFFVFFAQVAIAAGFIK